MQMADKCEKCKHLEEEAKSLESLGRDNVQSAIDNQLEAFGGKEDAKYPGRVRRFEQVKVMEREFYKMSDEDFEVARQDLYKVMKKYRGVDD